MDTFLEYVSSNIVALFVVLNPMAAIGAAFALKGASAAFSLGIM
jgi:hypothetical protein